MKVIEIKHRNGSSELVILSEKAYKPGDCCQAGGNIAGEVVIGYIKPFQVVELRDLQGKLAGKTVARKEEMSKL